MFITSKSRGFDMKATPSPARAPDWAATEVARQQEKMKPTTLNMAHTARGGGGGGGWGYMCMCGYV